LFFEEKEGLESLLEILDAREAMSLYPQIEILNEILNWWGL
jgi:hypothetical protein